MAIVGGGATIDYGKALVSLSRFRQRNITLILIPTNFGSAAELTPFATVWDFDKKVKQSVAMPFEFRRIAFYDDNALAGLNNLHAQIGFLDSVSHAFDSFISAESNSFLRNIALSNLTNCCSILSEFDYILEKFSPTKLQEISFYSGLCISQTKTSLTHGLSYWLTISHNIPHGIAVGLMLREVLDRHYFINELPHSLRKSLTESLLKIDFKSILGTRLVDANFDSFFAQIDLARVKNSTIKVGLDDLKSIFSSVVRSLEE
jgi:alcohol dehydrogenase